MFIFKNLVWISVLATSLLAFSGCESTVVVAPSAHCADQPVEVCHDYRDWHGIWHHECRTEMQHHCWATAQVLGNPVGAVGLGRDYDIGYDAAAALINAAVAANQRDPDPALQLGLSSQDFANLSKQQLPTDDGIGAVAKNLNQDTDTIRNLFAGIMRETQQNEAMK